jgi:hypothetical protein
MMISSGRLGPRPLAANISTLTGHPIVLVTRSRVADIELALEAAHKAKGSSRRFAFFDT